MRITKKYNERKNEILDIAVKLFYTKGYEKCTVNDILKGVGIEKGTFYYYFKSKEEVLDAIVRRYTEIIVNRAETICDSDMSPNEKLLRSFLALRIVDNELDVNILEELHKKENALLHQKTLNQIVTFIAPIMTKVIEEGNEKKIWNCKYPLQYMQIFLAAALTITDEGIFEIDTDSQKDIIVAFSSLLEKMLSVPENTFTKLFIQYWS